MWAIIFPASLMLFIISGCDIPSAEERLKRNHLPKPGYQADAIRGQRVFIQNCSSCHGLQALGTKQGPPLIDDIYRPSHHSNLSFHWAVKNGVTQHHWHFGNMPPIPQVNPEQTADIALWIRKRQQKAGIK